MNFYNKHKRHRLKNRKVSCRSEIEPICIFSNYNAFVRHMFSDYYHFTQLLKKRNTDKPRQLKLYVIDFYFTIRRLIMCN